MRKWLLLLIVCAASISVAQAEPPPSPLWPIRPAMSLPLESLKWTLNRTGDCVQCSNSQVGMHMGDMAQMTLLYDTEYGRAQLGGSGPDRVANYCRARGIEIYNITGRSFEDTKPWIDWAASTGRFAAVGCFSSHFQTLYYRDFETNRYGVMNNWSGTFSDPYNFSEAEFKRQHELSGPWVVIPKRPPPAPMPIYERWWERDSRVTAIERMAFNVALLPR